MSGGKERFWSIADLALLGVIIFWGSNFAALVFGVRELGAIPFTSMRFVLAAPLLAILHAVFGGRWRIAREDWPRLLFVSLFGTAFYQTFFHWSVPQTTSANGALLMALSPFFGLLIAVVLGEERWSPRLAWGALLATLGVAILVLGGAAGLSLRPGDLLQVRGDLLMLACSVIFAIYTVSLAPLVRRYPALQVMALTMIISAVATLPLAVSGLPPVRLAMVSMAAWASLAYAVLFTLVYGFTAWNWGVGRIGPARTMLYLYLQPVVAAAVGNLLLGQPVHAWQLPGALAVFAGVYVARSARQAQPAHAGRSPAQPDTAGHAQAAGTAHMAAQPAAAGRTVAQPAAAGHTAARPAAGVHTAIQPAAQAHALARPAASGNPAHSAQPGPATRGEPTAAVADRAGKERYVQDLFNEIAQSYDRMNLIMTAGLYRYWQWALSRHLRLPPGGRALDVACGTGDIALLMARRAGPPGEVIGLDFSENMLRIARARASRARGQSSGAGSCVLRFVQGNALSMPFPDDSFDVVTTGFAMRNVADVEGAFREMARVLRPDGQLLCLELSWPRFRLLRRPYFWYFRCVIPWLGRYLGSHSRSTRAGALAGPPPYNWLPQSLEGFPDQEGLAALMRRAGLRDVRYWNLTGGIACLHEARK